MECLIAIGVAVGLCLTLLRFLGAQKAEKLPATKVLIYILLCLISADYVAADYHKEKIKSSNIAEPVKSTKRTNYIKKWNVVNCVISAVLAVVSYLLIMFLKNADVSYFFFGLMFYSAVSRTMEINIAFIKDVVSKKKSIRLDRNERIKLALISLAEEVFVFCGLYAIFCNNWYEPILGGLHSIILNKFDLDMVTSSFYGSDVWFKFITVYQVICTIALLTVSVANYISTPNESSCKSLFQCDGDKHKSDCVEQSDIDKIGSENRSK